MEDIVVVLDLVVHRSRKRELVLMVQDDKTLACTSSIAVRKEGRLPRYFTIRHVEGEAQFKLVSNILDTEQVAPLVEATDAP